MSANRLHVAVGDSGAGMLQALRRDGLLDGEVLAFIEDLSAGPLLDADAIDQGLRLAWHQQLLQAQPWSPEYEDDWLRRHQASRRLLRLLEQPRPLTVWLGRNAGDHLALALLAEQLPAHCPLSVVAVPEPAWQAGDEMAEWSLAMLPLERLAACLPQQLPISAAERQALAAQWRHWREHGLGLRRWQGQRHRRSAAGALRCAAAGTDRRGPARYPAPGRRRVHPHSGSAGFIRFSVLARAATAARGPILRRKRGWSGGFFPANPPLRLSPSCYSATSVLKDYSKRLVMHRRAGKIPALDACPAIEWQRPAILRNPTP